mgnify:CR=1 FL=1
MTDQDIEKYVRLYHTMLYRVAFSYLRSSADAEDVCQESFIRLLKFPGDFPTDEDCKRWLIRVAVNLSKNLLKYRCTHGEPMEYPDASDKPTAESELLPLIKSLPPEYSTVIHLFYYEDYSTREIAQILDISVTAVTSRLSRGRRRLKQLLTEED